MMESVGLFIGLDGNPIATHNSILFEISNPQPGEVSVVNVKANSTDLTASGQSVYTCRIPLQSGEIREINIGIYPSGFTGKCLPLYISDERNMKPETRLLMQYTAISFHILTLVPPSVSYSHSTVTTFWLLRHFSLIVLYNVTFTYAPIFLHNLYLHWLPCHQCHMAEGRTITGFEHSVS